MKFIIGKKINMTQVWQGENVVAVTEVKVEPCTISQIKSKETDGYSAIQIASGERKEKNIKKPQKGHFKEAGVSPKIIKEFKVDNVSENLKVGNKIDINSFASGDKIDAVGISKGKGFQGVVKRYGFAGAIKTHGTKDQVRMPGSIGATGPAHVFKGTRMGGRMGGDRVTVKNLEIVEVDDDNNILLIKGAVPGARNGFVMINGEGELKVVAEDIKEEQVEKEKVEEKEAVKNEESIETKEEKVEEAKEEVKKEEKKEDIKKVEEEKIEEVKKEAQKEEVKKEESN